MKNTADTFAISTYKKFKSVNITSYFVDLGISIFSSIVIAQCVSSVALAAVSVVNPLYSVVLFISLVIGDATANKVQLELGAFNKEKAGNMLMTGLTVAIISGILILLFFLFGARTYFNFMNVSESTTEYAMEYLTFYQISFALFPFNVTLDYYIADSANVKLMFAKRGVTLFCNTVLAFLFTTWLGIAGIGLASLVSNIAGICLMNTHFVSEFTAVKPKWMKIELGYVKALKGALAGGTKQLTAAVCGMIINKIIIDKFGAQADDLLSILGIVGSVTVFECVYEALAQTARSQMDIYSVEGNYKTARVLIKAAIKDSLISSVILFVVYMIGAPLVPIIYNISDPELAQMCTSAIRWAVALTPCFALYTNFICIHQGLQHFITVTLSILTENLIVYCIVMGLLTEWFGASGIWMSYGLYPTVSLIIIIVATLVYTKINKDRSFPWLFDLKRPQPTVYNVEMSEAQVMAVRDDVDRLMTEADVDARTKYQMSLVIEEFGMLVVEKNKIAKMAAVEAASKITGKKKSKKDSPVLSEWDLWIDKDAVTVIVRDNGTSLDFSDENNSTGSLGAYFLSCLIPNIGQVNYATAISMNRHRFQVARADAGESEEGKSDIGKSDDSKSDDEMKNP